MSVEQQRNYPAVGIVATGRSLGQASERIGDIRLSDPPVATMPTAGPSRTAYLAMRSSW